MYLPSSCSRRGVNRIETARSRHRSRSGSVNGGSPQSRRAAALRAVRIRSDLRTRATLDDQAYKAAVTECSNRGSRKTATGGDSTSELEKPFPLVRGRLARLRAAADTPVRHAQ
jgi:hypothetical protein